MASALALVAVLVACAAFALLAGSARAATMFERLGSFAETQADWVTLHHNQRVAVEHSTDRVFKTDVVGDRVVVYAPNGTGADELTGFGAGELVDPYGIAIDQSSGDVYVSDAGNNRVVRYLSDGQPTPVYTRDLGYAGPAQGAGAGEVGDFRAPIAIDQASGKLLVADPGSDLVKRYTATGAYDGFSFDGAGSSGVFTGLQDLAVDSTGDVIVIDSDGGDPADGAITRVERFDSAGVWEATIGPVDQAATVAVRPVNDEVIVSGTQNAGDLFMSPTLHVFDSSSSRQTPVDGSAAMSTISGIAVDDGPSGRLFVATDTSRGLGYPAMFGLASVQVYEVFVPVPPVVEPRNTTGVTTTTATLHASVDPRWTDTTYYFEYGTTTAFGSQTTPVSIGAGGSEVTVTEQLEGLTPNATYYFRVVADNGVGGSVHDEVRTFVTWHVPLVAITGQATGVATTSATLNGTVDTQGVAGSYQFDVEQVDGPYRHRTAAAGVAASGDPVAVSASVDGLPPGAEFVAKLSVATTVGGGTGRGVRFSTPPLADVADPPVDRGESAYGCSAPRLDRRVGRVGPGGTVALTGSGLGIDGSVTVAGRPVEVTDYGQTRISIVVPDDARGSVAVIVDCGRESAQTTLTVRPSNRFALSVRPTGPTATLVARVPGRGRIAVRGKGVGRVAKRVAGQGRVALRVKLTRKARQALARSRTGRLTRSIAVTYRPAGGSARTVTRRVTFERSSR